MNNPRWKGIFPAVTTKFHADESLDLEGTIFCRCEDVAYAAVAACSGWTEAKLATRCGMGACQGRVCGAAAQHLWGWQTPSPRPPLSPARVGTLSRMAQDPPHP